jgi:ABC-2 type transport system permease protein
LFLIPVILALGAVAGCLSLLVGVVCVTEKQVNLVAIFGTMGLSALGGCWWPIEIVPESFKTIATFTPSYWAMHGIQSVLYFGRSHEVLRLEVPVLLGFAALFGGAAIAAARLLVRRADAGVS